MFHMPKTKSKKKKNKEDLKEWKGRAEGLDIKVRDLQDEVKQLRGVLEASRRYADKLVDNIPYLPADILNLRKANAEMAAELKKISNKKKFNKNADFIKRFASVSSLMVNINQSLEFPGPYSVTKAGELNIYHVKSKNGVVLMNSTYNDVTDIVVGLMNLARELIIDEIEVTE